MVKKSCFIAQTERKKEKRKEEKKECVMSALWTHMFVML